MKVKCLLIDDEPLAITVLENHIQHIDFLEVAGIFSNAVDAYNYLQRQTVDLIFLDINMPKLNGMALLKSLQNPPQVILTTAYREFALEGYEYNVLDYLLKPIPFDRFLKAVGKIKPAVTEATDITKLPLVQEGADYLFLKSNKKMVKVYLQDIFYIESLKDYVKVVSEDATIITYQRISQLEELLPRQSFVRIHKSYIVNLHKVESYSSSAIEINKKELPFGRMYKNEALKLLMNV